MSEVAIRVEELSKKFSIGQQRSGDLRETFRQLFGSFSTKGVSSGGTFWALRDISFEVKRGEVVGIIGRNGAGKSTLLKILSRITQPSAGRFEIDGRVSSLLEVGTGFHMELTGRENIFLNGTILGMRKTEIRRKFDEIVSFSGVENFIDTPVKHYSSGMKVRLAFSVAAHLEPEILIIDEVLAVGDAEFQRRCLGKMDEVSKKAGRTVLFVSHNMSAVQNLCGSGILLDDGRILLDDKIESVVRQYQKFHDQSQPLALSSKAGQESIKFKNADIVGSNGAAGRDIGISRIGFKEDFKIVLRLEAEAECRSKLYIAITIFDETGVKVATLDNLFIERPFYFSGKTLEISCAVKSINLNPGVYYCSLWSSNGFDTIQRIDSAVKFEVVATNYLGTGMCHSAGKHGVIYLDQQWAVN